MIRRYESTCAGEKSKLLFLKTKETEREEEKEEDLEDLVKNRMRKD
jgi:Flp pilus assembly CpaF family ATPase